MRAGAAQDKVCGVAVSVKDKYGRPVYIELLGGLDCGAMLKAAPLERIMKYHIWTWERMERQLLPACSRLVGHPVITATVIIDLAGLSLRNFTLTAQRLLSTIAKIDQDYYPEHLGTMFIINTSWFFTTIWAVVYPLLEERTRKKIIVLGSNYQDKLKELIPEENLPTFFGGLSPCPDKQSSQGLWTSEEPCTSSSWLPVGHTAQDPPPTQPAAKGGAKQALICPEGADALPCDEDSIPVGVACAALEGLGVQGPLPAKQLPQAKVDAVAV
ncbi:hypothetical protein QJQ45_006593 [Haematococcus lacustris]|nr:hypothetical protein QJQ45_006593 [Haematococcus lacustris]